MEGAIYAIEATVSTFVSLASFVLLVLAVSGLFFGHMAEEEKATVRGAVPEAGSAVAVQAPLPAAGAKAVLVSEVGR